MALKRKLTRKCTGKATPKSVIHKKSSYHPITIKTEIVNDYKEG